MNRIDRVFDESRHSGRKVFLPFLVAGDPDLGTTVRAAEGIYTEAERLGVPLILELGFPYSDPLADGPTIQAAYTRALDRGVHVADVFSAVRDLRKRRDFPIVGMVAYSIVYRKHPHEFLAQAQASGFDGLIIPDLPVEESGEVHAWGKAHDFKVIQLVAPTTREDRLDRIASASTGFLYYISVTGITGERKRLPVDLVDRVEQLRGHCKVPIAIGFGVSEPEQVALLSQVADGVIVGSALVRRVAEVKPGGPLTRVTEFAGPLMGALAR